MNDIPCYGYGCNGTGNATMKDGSVERCRVCGGKGVLSAGDASIVEKFAKEVFRIAGGDNEVNTKPTIQDAIDCLTDLRQNYDEALKHVPLSPVDPRGFVSLINYLGDARIKFQMVHASIDGTVQVNKDGTTSFKMVTGQENLAPIDLLAGPRKLGFVLWVDKEHVANWQKETA